jgi:hypothetical protein
MAWSMEPGQLVKVCFVVTTIVPPTFSRTKLDVFLSSFILPHPSLTIIKLCDLFRKTPETLSTLIRAAMQFEDLKSTYHVTQLEALQSVLNSAATLSKFCLFFFVCFVFLFFLFAPLCGIGALLWTKRAF